MAIVVLTACVAAEPPVGYSYKRPAPIYHAPAPIYSAPSQSYVAPAPSYSAPIFTGGFVGGHSGGHGSIGFGGGGGYHAVSSGYQTSEGLHVDPALLHKVKQILLDQENIHGGGGHGGHHDDAFRVASSSYRVPSSSYGVPSTSYGVPGYSTRVVGIELGGIRQGLQVAQYHQESPIYSSGYSLGHGGGSRYSPSFISAPSGSYGVPSGSYGVPSGSYGPPH